MPGKWITQQQVKLYMKSRTEGNTQEVSSAKSGMSVRTGRMIEQGKRTNPHHKKRHWRTRKDPFLKVWQSELVPMLEESPALQAITLLEYLQQQYPGKYEDSLLRTIQRRVKRWRSLYGPEKEVMFRQQHYPGQQALSDFTQLKRVTITIAGQPFKHLLYHFRLIYSKWSYMKVIIGGESYTALAEGLQEALNSLGGSPFEHRTDSLSAAFKNLSKMEKEDITKSYEELCQHYQMKATRNNPGNGHENGGVESPHGHIKRRIEQALLIRGSNDFACIAEYRRFIEKVVSQQNRRNAKTIILERQLLKPLPIFKGIDYKLVQAVVSSSSTIDVRKVTYTVPSRLQGETLQVRLYDDRLLCYLGYEHVITLSRAYPIGKTTRARQVDYRHVIHSLIKKPQAFRYSQIRDELLPNLSYKLIWTHINNTMSPRPACRLMVGLLHLAASADCESELSKEALRLINRGKQLELANLQSKFKQKSKSALTFNFIVSQHALAHYDHLIPHLQEASHV